MIFLYVLLGIIILLLLYKLFARKIITPHVLEEATSSTDILLKMNINDLDSHKSIVIGMDRTFVVMQDAIIIKLLEQFKIGHVEIKEIIEESILENNKEASLKNFMFYNLYTSEIRNINSTIYSNLRWLLPKNWRCPP